MRLFYKPKVLKFSDLMLKFNTFSFIKNEFSNNLLEKINELFGENSSDGLKLFINKNTTLKDEEFKIDTSPEEINIYAKTETAAYYALLTLKDILKQTSNCFYVEDYPDLEIRGVMVDISRSKVPTKETLKEMIKLFSKRLGSICPTHCQRARIHYHGRRTLVLGMGRLCSRGASLGGLFFTYGRI